MAMESITVKLEPTDLPESNDCEPPNAKNGSEFVNIKVEVTPNSSIKQELEVEVSPPEGDNDIVKKEWVVPLEDDTSVLPDACVEVVMETNDTDDIKNGTATNIQEVITNENSVEPQAPALPAPSTSQLLDPLTPSGSQELGPKPRRIRKQINLPSDVTIKSEYTPAALALLHMQNRLTELVKSGVTCPICDKKFANTGNVQRHMLIHTKEKYNCTECIRHFCSKELLDKHMAKHQNALYPCDQCQKTFKTTSNLMQHKNTHLEIKPFSCSVCNRSFAFRANLAKHIGKSRCKVPNNDPIECHVCNKTFDKRFLLKSHLRRHDTDKPFECDRCKMTFKHKGTLIRHIQMHNGIRPYVCSYCNKSFTHSALLKPHIRIHTGEKPYQCTICEKKFSHKHNMQRHVTRHSKIKQLVCEICHRKFPKESRLKYHMRTHVNEKHFACQVCPKRFSHKQNVIRHYTRKHPNKKYECKDTDASVALKVWDTMQSKYNEPEEILGNIN